MEDTVRIATGKDIILEIVRSMRVNVEPLLFSTIAPARFYVYLHPDDHKRLEGIFPLILDQATRALDTEVAKWNAETRGRRPLRWLARGAKTPELESPRDGWEIRFEMDADEEMQPGDIAVASELRLPPAAELAGSLTRRVTVRSGDPTSQRQETVEPSSPSVGTVYATLTYEDQRGRETYAITKNQVVIGRGGVGYWVDLKLQTAQDVSREHARLRRDEATGQFFLKDVSTLGTTVDGQPVPTSVEVAEGTRRDKNVEVPLPARARIGLAETVFLDFEARRSS
jgi:hypothetical protein